MSLADEATIYKDKKHFVPLRKFYGYLIEFDKYETVNNREQNKRMHTPIIKAKYPKRNDICPCGIRYKDEFNSE
jgi:hypothetical protein